jgi:hypothetical protein
MLIEDSVAWGSPAPRIDAAQAIMNLLRLGEPYLDHFRATVEGLLGDPHPAVRLQIAERLVSAWDTDRSWMWRLADRIAGQETNRSVLAFFANYFLARTIHHAPGQVEALTSLLRTPRLPP